MLACTLALLTDAKEPEQQAQTSTTELLGRLNHAALTESSGLAASCSQPGIFWTHNDSSGKPSLFAFTGQGDHIATATVEGATADDWEDICAFTWRDQHWILIADTGNNWARRDTFVLYVVKDPLVDPDKPETTVSIPVAWKIRFKYKEDPQDCEAVAVDTATEQVLLATKREVPAALYSLPLRGEGDEILVAQRSGELSQLPRPSLKEVAQNPILGKYYHQPTAMDLSPNRKHALVVTYKHAYLFTKEGDQEWHQVFAATPQVIKLPERKQGESGCFTSDGQGIVVGSEGKASPLWLVRLDRFANVDRLPTKQ
jgi:hypothetical protein